MKNFIIFMTVLFLPVIGLLCYAGYCDWQRNKKYKLEKEKPSYQKRKDNWLKQQKKESK